MATGIRWRDGLNVFNMSKVFNCQRLLYKGYVRLSLEGWMKDYRDLTEKKAKMDKFINGI